MSYEMKKKTATVVPIDHKKSEKYVPYELAWTETPLLHWLRSCLRYWIQGRNAVIRNPFFDWRIPFPCYKRLNRAFTLGEIVVYLLWLAGTIAIAVCAFVLYWDVEGTGSIAVIPLAITFALAAKNSLLTFLLGIPFERQIFWHKCVALTAVIWGWVHGIIYLIGWESKGGGGDSDEDEGDEDEETSGLVFTIAMTLLIVFSLDPIRRFVWNIFYSLHIVLFIITIIGGVIHGAGSLLIGVAFWGFDFVMRHLYLAMIRNPKSCTAIRLPANVVRLTFAKEGFEFGPGQYVCIMIPKVNIFEWHPFSISSSPHHDKVSIHIRVLGNWTKSLYDKLAKDGPINDLRVFVHGPYGSPEIDADNEKYKLFLLISGGIGITPMQSLCNHLVHEHDAGRPLKKVWFVWSCADKYMVSATFEHDREWAGDSNQRLPLSFQPDNLERLSSDHNLLERKDTVFDSNESSDVLHTEFYLTRVRSAGDYQDANIRPELQPFLKFGRPKLTEIFTTMRNYAVHMKEKNVAVLVCGPMPMINEVRGLASSMSQDGVRFDFHSEVFEF